MYLCVFRLQLHTRLDIGMHIEKALIFSFSKILALKHNHLFMHSMVHRKKSSFSESRKTQVMQPYSRPRLTTKNFECSIIFGIGTNELCVLRSLCVYVIYICLSFTYFHHSVLVCYTNKTMCAIFFLILNKNCAQTS